MRVWQIRAVLRLVAFFGACDRSPDHTSLCCCCFAVCGCATLVLLQLCFFAVDSSSSNAEQSDSRRQRRGQQSAVRTYKYLLFVVGICRHWPMHHMHHVHAAACCLYFVELRIISCRSVCRHFFNIFRFIPIPVCARVHKIVRAIIALTIDSSAIPTVSGKGSNTRSWCRRSLRVSCCLIMHVRKISSKTSCNCF